MKVLRKQEGQNGDGERQIDDKVEILENKTDIMDRELERERENLLLLELRKKEFLFEI